MKIAVCVSHVPDTTTKIIVGSDGKTIDKTGVTFIINPYDEFAVEEALRLKEKFGGEITAISIGTDAVKETLRKAFAMGIEKGIWIKEQGELDSSMVAQLLAEVLKNISPDLILFGKQSVDYDSSQVGALVAEILNIPSISVVTRLEINDGKVTCEREIEGGKEIVESNLPVVISCQKGLNEPRYPNLKGIMAAKTKPIQEISIPDKNPLTEILSMRKPVSKSGGRILGTDANAVPELIKLLHEEVKVI
jgi:electron transfer flavoprotein beta subunit